MSARGPAAALAALLTLAAWTPGAGDAAGKRAARYEWEGVSRIVVLGDLHGADERLIELLRGSGLVSPELAWTGGSAHLVVVGDLLDRRPGDRPILDLLRALEAPAAAAGGRVHVLLGNHEVMNLTRDLRYVAPGSYAYFAGDESRAERERAWRLFVERRAQPEADPREARARFDREYPPGFFARQRAFDPSGGYGGWLLDLPVAIKINGIVFVHGGMTERTAELGLPRINRGARRELVRHLKSRAALERYGVVTPLMDYTEMHRAAADAAGRLRLTPRVRSAATAFTELADSRLHGLDGPLWYRGNAREDERIERGRLEGSLELLGARAMVVAHSPTPGKTINSRFGGLLYCVDHGIAAGNRPLALVFEDGAPAVLDVASGARTPPVLDRPQGRRVARAGPQPSDLRLERLLTDGAVVGWRELGRGSTRPLLVELRDEDLEQRGLFKSVQTDDPGWPGERPVADRYQHEVAAYLVDRRLGLNLVPVTVVREVLGRQGSLQLWIDGAVDQRTARAYDLAPADPRAVDEQLRRAAIFDALIGNPQRRPDDILYLLERSRVFLVDHSRAFAPDAAPASSGEAAPGPPGPRLAQALAALDARELRERLGELLDERQIGALLERRDAILQRSAAPAEGADCAATSPR